MEIYFAIEVISVLFGLAFLVLLIRQNILCWWFGIVGSLLSIFLFYHTKLYSEAILYTYYVLMGFYGYYSWNNNKS
ncbi:MAG: nicotinamide mononucleotide transporter, partial [Flavobacteriales bacterium]